MAIATCYVERKPLYLQLVRGARTDQSRQFGYIHMDNHFFERPILNSPYDYPAQYWELDEHGQPTQRIIESRRRAEFITPIPKPRKRTAKASQAELVFDEGKGLSTEKQQYDPTSAVINELRFHVDQWRNFSNPNDWKVTPDTQRLLQHWRHHKFSDVRPFFCQIEAVETAIWLTEVAPQLGKSGKRFLEHLADANNGANPELMRLALKLATGAGKTTVMAMVIAWQTINAVRQPGSSRFTRGFLVVTPGLTIRDRLRVLQPNDPDSYFKDRELVPSDMLGELDHAKIVITNYHAFKLRERVELSKGGRSLLQGRGDELNTLETEGQMIQRVMPGLMGLKNILVLNDEAHHCYRAKPEVDEIIDLKGDDKEEAKKNNETARLWISGLEIVKRKLGITRVMDLSATPFFLRGSGYAEGTLFPWTMSDFSLMDAIECGIVKLPRVPVADNIPGGDMPMFRNLWEHIRTKMPKKGRGKAETLDPLKLPMPLTTALEALYGHYEKTYEEWIKHGVRVPPCFIIVCNNTSTSKLVYDYISGFHRQNEDGSTTLENGRLALFRNFDEHGNPFARPCTLLIDSEEIESGDALDDNFRIDGRRRDRPFSPRDHRADRRPPSGRKHHRSGTAPGSHEHRRQTRPTRRIDPVRGLGLHAHGRLGRQHRHPCSRRACFRHAAPLRTGNWPGASPTVLRTQRRQQVQRRIRRRAGHSVRFHREAGDRSGAAAPRDHPGEGDPPRPRRARNPISRGLLATGWNCPRSGSPPSSMPIPILELTPDLVGPSITKNEGIIGEGVELSLEHLDDMRLSTVLFHLTKRLVYTKWRDAGEDPKLHLFGQLKRITKQWLDTCLVCKGGTKPAQLLYPELAEHGLRADHRRHHAIPGRHQPHQGCARSLQSRRLHRAREVQHVANGPLADRRPPVPHQLGDPR